MSDESHPHEIIIIKRHGGGHDDGHHGGAWKIAYADFVTAMMAFFLVMWLLSASDKTKAALVKYFNPIQLVDATPQPPGLGDPSDKAAPDPKKVAKAPEKDPAEPAKESKPAKPAKEVQDAKEGKESKEAKKDEGRKDDVHKDDAALFKDPYAVLGEIAAKDASPAAGAVGKAPSEGKAQSEGTKGGAGPAAAADGRGGEAFRDPFDPASMRPAGAADSAADRAAEGAGGRADPPTASAAASATVAAPPAPAVQVEPPDLPLPAAPAAKASELRSRIDALMKSVQASNAGPEPKVEVRQTPEGVLIALTDDAKFSMFSSGSAEPSPRTVTLMEKVGRLLKAQKGRIVLRGYTDARKYRSDTYDNWRLSSSRADMAHYMLVRGGVDDARFERIEGYADRQLRNAKDPGAPENRRIEILLREAP